MRFACFDSATGQLLYRYEEAEEKQPCTSCLRSMTQHEQENALCSKDMYFAVKADESHSRTFAFCMKEARTRQQAKFLVQIAVKAFFNGIAVDTKVRSIHESAAELAVHNTRNLNAEINSKLLRLVGEEGLSRSGDKIDYIRARVAANPVAFAREFLSILKSTSQIMS